MQMQKMICFFITYYFKVFFKRNVRKCIFPMYVFLKESKGYTKLYTISYIASNRTPLKAVYVITHD